MSTIEKLLEKQEKERQEFWEEQEIISLLPATPQTVVMNPTRWVVYKVKDLADAMRLWRKFDTAVPYVSGTVNGFRYVSPVELLSGRGRALIAVDFVTEHGTPFIHVYAGDGFHELQMRFWYELSNKQIVQVVIEVEDNLAFPCHYIPGKQNKAPVKQYGEVGQDKIIKYNNERVLAAYLWCHDSGFEASINNLISQHA